MQVSKLEKKVNKALRRMIQLGTKQAMVRHYTLLRQLETAKPASK